MSKGRSSKPEPHNETVGSGTVLSRLTLEDLRVIKVSICRRSYVPGNNESAIIDRSLGDAASLLVHKSEEHTERRTVLRSPKRSRSRSYYSSRSPKPHSPSRSPSQYSKKNGTKQSEYVRNIGSSSDRGDEYRSSDKRDRNDDFAHTKPSRCVTPKEKSPKPGTSRKDYERNSKERRDSDSHRRNRRESPKEKNRTPSPTARKYKSDKDKYPRRSPSPHSRKHSRSPHPHRSRSPMHFRRRSRSPHYKRSPRDDRGAVASSSVKTGRRSRSFEKSNIVKRSVSPYSRRRSRSPNGPRKYSRSPSNRRRNYSRSPSKRGYKPAPPHPEGEFMDYQYFGAEGYWIPGAMHRPGFVPRGAIHSPMFIPRGAPYMLPRPYLPMHHSFRPRFPYNQPYRHRASTPAAVTTTTSTTTAVSGTTTTTTADSTPIIEEVPDVEKPTT